MKRRQNRVGAGFLLIEATIAILISILLSSIIVMYHGKSALMRAQTLYRSQALAGAISTLEGLWGSTGIDDSIPTGCTVHTTSIPLLSQPMVEGVNLTIPSLAPLVQVRVVDNRLDPERILVITSWLGEAS
jgi:hypothetical protein